jgi:hypothetical protein
MSVVLYGTHFLLLLYLQSLRLQLTVLTVYIVNYLHCFLTYTLCTQTLAKTEGLISALEPSHAIYHAMQVHCTIIMHMYSSRS